MPTLSIDIEARLAKWQDGLDKVVSASNKSAKQIESAFNGVLGTIKLIGAGWIAREIARSFQAFVDLQSQFVELSQSTGIAVDALSGYDYAARLSGVRTEELAKALTKLNSQFLEAKANSGGDEAKTFRALGIDPQKINSAEEALRAVATRFSEFRDGAIKTEYAVRLFGERIGPKLIPFLNQGAEGFDRLRQEAARLGLVFDNETAAKVEQFGDNLDTLKFHVGALARELFSQLVPALNETIKKFLQARASGLGVFDALNLSLPDPIMGTDRFKVAIDEAQAQVAKLNAEIDKLHKDPWPGGKEEAKRAQLIKDRAVAEQRLAQLIATRAAVEYQAAQEAAAIGPPKPPARGREPKPPPAKGVQGKTDAQRMAEDVDKEVLALQRRAATLQQNTELEQALFDVTQGRFKAATPEQQQRILDAAAELDIKKEQVDAEKELQDIIKRGLTLKTEEQLKTEETEAAYKALLEQTEEAENDRFVRLVAYIEKQRELGDITDDTAGKLKKMATGQKDELDKMTEFSLEAARNIQDAMGSGLYNILKGNFDNIASSFLDMLNRMVSEAVAANLAEALFGDFAKSKKIGGLLGEGIKWLAGAFGGSGVGGTEWNALGSVWTKPGRRTAFALGGVFNTPTFFPFADGIGVMAEKEAEAIMPLKRGPDGSLGVVAHGGGGVQFNTNIYAAPGMNVAQMEAYMDSRDARLRAEFADSLRRGRLSWAAR